MTCARHSAAADAAVAAGAPGASGATDADGARSHRVYGRRWGRRLRAGRSALFQSRLPELAIALPAADGVLDPRTLFAKPVDDIWLEIGFGNGEHLLAQAQSHPHIGFLGCEPFLNGVAALIAGLHRHQLDNVRIFADDVRGLLAALPDASIGRMFVLFSDPWPKRRHHRRRVITVETAPALARVLKDGASLWFASDHCGYVQAALQTLSGSDDFRWTAQAPDDWRRRPVELFPTRYESKALARGASCVYLRFERMKRV